MQGGSTQCFLSRTGTLLSAKEASLAVAQGSSGVVVGVLHYMSLVAGTCSETKKMYHGGSVLKLADDDV